MGPPETGNAAPTCKCSPCGVEGADFASRLLDDLRKAYILRDDKCCEESDATRSFSVMARLA